MKRLRWMLFLAFMAVFAFTGVVQAAPLGVVIGTATYTPPAGGTFENHQLIWDEGDLVWFDWTNFSQGQDGYAQTDWAENLGDYLDVTLDPVYADQFASADLSAGWRLPTLSELIGLFPASPFVATDLTPFNHLSVPDPQSDHTIDRLWTNEVIGEHAKVLEITYNADSDNYTLNYEITWGLGWPGTNAVAVWSQSDNDVTVIPEPSTWLLMGIGLAALVAFRKRLLPGRG